MSFKYLALILFITACNSQEPIDKEVVSTLVVKDSLLSTVEINKLNDVLKKIDAPAQFFKVSSKKQSTVTGKRGTKIVINPNDLEFVSGGGLGSEINVELKELVNQTELLRSNTITVADGKPLISGGAYYINLTADKKQLKLKANRKLTVSFPTIGNTDNMDIFYGNRDNTERINWTLNNEGIAVKNAKTEAKIEVFEDYRNTSDSSSEIDLIIGHIENEKVKPISKADKAKNDKFVKLYTKVYEEISVSQLGWINVDMYDVSELSDINFTFKDDSVKYFNVYVVFKGINSVLQEYWSKNNTSIKNVPIGQKVKLIAYTFKNEKLVAHQSELITAKNQSINLEFKEIAESDIKKLFSR